MNIPRDFEDHNPKTLYIDHHYIGNDKIGISYIAILNGQVLGGVNTYQIINNQVDWTKVLKHYESWKDVKGIQR